MTRPCVSEPYGPNGAVRTKRSVRGAERRAGGSSPLGLFDRALRARGQNVHDASLCWGAPRSDYSIRRSELEGKTLHDMYPCFRSVRTKRSCLRSRTPSGGEVAARIIRSGAPSPRAEFPSRVHRHDCMNVREGVMLFSLFDQ
jgi:hypothetical protein